MLPKHDPQIEAVCADGPGRVLLFQETPPRVELIDPEAPLSVVASIDLAVEGRGEIARAWSDPKGSRAKKWCCCPAGICSSPRRRSRRLSLSSARQIRGRWAWSAAAHWRTARWPIKKGRHGFVALAIWLPDKILAKTCAGFSDLENGPDGRLYLLSDKSSTIARLDDLPSGGGAAALLVG